MVTVLQIEHDFGVMIVTSHTMMSVPGTRAHMVSEYARKEFAEIGRLRIAKSMGAEFKARIPSRRWLEITASMITALPQLIISCAFFRIGKHRIRFIDFLHLLLGTSFFGNIRMILTRHAAERFFDLFRTGIACHIEYLVIIFEFQIDSPQVIPLRRMARSHDALSPEMGMRIRFIKPASAIKTAPSLRTSRHLDRAPSFRAGN